MGQLAEQLKAYDGNTVKIENPSDQPSEPGPEIKNAVRDKVRTYAEKLKEWDDNPEGAVKTDDFSKLFADPVKLNAGGAPNLALVFSLVIAIITAGILGFLFTREAASKKQMGIQLELSRGEQSRLEQSVSKLKADLESQKSEVNKLSLDLKDASTKSFEFDKMKADHEAELTRIKNFYETQITSLKAVLQSRDEMARTLQGDLESIKRILERGAVSASVGAATTPAPTQPVALAMSPEPVSTSETTLAKQLAQVSDSDEDGTAQGFAQGLIAGRVISIDYKNRFLITNISAAQGAKPGMIIRIHQNRKYLGDVRIDKIYQNLSAAVISSNDVLEHVEEGDTAFLIPQ